MYLKKKIQSSIASKLTLWVLVLTCLVFLVGTTIIYHVSRTVLVDNLNDNSTLSMKNAVSGIEKSFNSICKTIDNIALIMEQEAIPQDSLYSVVKYVVMRNPNIVGSAIAFEPYYNKNKDYYYSPYAYREAETILTKQLGNKSYDYFSMDWYVLPKVNKCGNWTRPYFDEGGGSYLMCTYSAPIYNKKGDFIGVITADVSLMQVAKAIAALKPSPNSHSFAVYKDGSYFYKDKYYSTTHHSIFSNSDILEDPKAKASIIQDMMEGKAGSYDISSSKVVYYVPIPGVDWSLGMVIDKAYLYKDLQTSTNIVLIVIILGIVLVFVVCRLLIGSQIKPLTLFANSAKEIALGHLDTELPVIKTKDEMRQLYNSFIYLKEELVHYMDSLTQTVIANEKIESELRIARSIQMSLIPKSFPVFPKQRSIDLAALLRPAKQVGGDLYDFFIDSNQLYFCIGDVSDKGIPAAIFMALTRSQFRSIAATHANAQAIVESMNKAMSENNDANMFVTLIAGIMNINTGEIEYCNAGHNSPCIITDGKAEFINIKPSLPLGIIPDAVYQNEYLKLSKDQILLFYTDGVNEAENSKKEQFGDNRLLRSITTEKCNSAQNIVDTVITEVDNFVLGANQSDDITMLALKYNGYSKDKLLILKNKITELSRMNKWMDSILEVDDATKMQINLALEEVVTNVILYAYPMDGKEYEFALRYYKEGNTLCFQIEDQGAEFNPTLKKDADITLGAEERPIGGLGIYLTKQLMTSVEYYRKDDTNVLTLKKEVDS